MPPITLQKPRYIRKGNPSAPDYALMESDLSGSYADDIKNRLSGGSLAWQTGHVKKDAYDVAAEFLNADPDVLVDVVLAAQRGQADRLLELVNELIGHSIDSVSISRAVSDIDRAYPTY